MSGYMDVSEYAYALRDNDIRHIRNSHGENTNEKYPVTKEDIMSIPYIVENYDKIFYKTNAHGAPEIVYVKVMSDNVVYYVEAVIEQYHNEKLLVNKQMVKTGIDDIPNLYGLIDAINKKQSSSQYLADLEKIRKAYVHDVKEIYSTDIISNPDKNVNSKASLPQGQKIEMQMTPFSRFVICKDKRMHVPVYNDSIVDILADTEADLEEFSDFKDFAKNNVSVISDKNLCADFGNQKNSHLCESYLFVMPPTGFEHPKSTSSLRSGRPCAL